jgi:hypothetical protein
LAWETANKLRLRYGIEITEGSAPIRIPFTNFLAVSFLDADRRETCAEKLPVEFGQAFQSRKTDFFDGVVELSAPEDARYIAIQLGGDPQLGIETALPGRK